MVNYRMTEVLEAWDTLKTFISYERTPKRVKWLRSSYEIEGNIDEWLENKESNVVEEYSKLREISFDEAVRELMERPTKPWPDVKRNPEPSQFEFHLKPSGWTGAPCPICGCATKNLRARHRALKSDEAHRWGAPYIKRVKVSFGTDFSDEPLKE
jgi:hypothetical protein